MAQAPKLLAHFPAIVENIAADCINVKATTTEKPGFAGDEEIVGVNFRWKFSKPCRLYPERLRNGYACCYA